MEEAHTERLGVGTAERAEAHGIHGECDPAFVAVREAFERNFAERGEVGAACAVYHRGRKVVDLWGGWAHRRRRRPWERDTLVLVYSTTKGAAATTVALAHSRGLLDYDERVAAYWPEFAQNGKAEVTVRQLLAHQAGLPAISTRLDPQTIGDRERLARALAEQKPAWRPGTRHGYHALSIGWYESELIRRVDPQGRSLGRFFADEVAAPLDMELYMGLPESVPSERVAHLSAANPMALLDPGTLPRQMLLALAWPGSLTARTFRNPRLRGPIDLARPDYRVLEVPAGGGIGQVRSLARMYGDLATGGHDLGLSATTLAELSAPPRPPSGGSFDLVLRTEAAYALGFVRPTPERDIELSPRAFGHPGAGGSFAFADPDVELGFAYAPNHLGYRLRDDPRERALRAAAYRSLERA